MPRADVLLVSLGGTAGLREADAELAEGLRRAGAVVAEAHAARVREWRTYALIELAWARSARAAAQEGIAAHRPRAVLYSSTTAALLAPGAGRDPLRRPGGRQPAGPPRDLAAAGGAAEAGEREAAGAVERGRARRGAAAARGGDRRAGAGGAQRAEAAERDIAAITYGANPEKKGLDRVLAAWAAARRPGEELVVAGLDRPSAEGVRYTGMLPRAEYRALLRRARVFVCAPRREDYGIAQLEALADGCMLVTTPSPGPYAALPLARALDPRLVGGVAEGDPHGARRSRPGLRRARAGRARAVAARGGRPRDRRAAAPAATVARMTPLSGQSVLITGAAHGIGAEVARRLAARGARVSLVGLGADELRRVAADCPGSVVFDADVTDQEALDAAVAGTVEAFGGIDTVFANAGIAAPGFIRTMDPAAFERDHRGQPDRRLAHDPSLPAARHRAPRLHPAGRARWPRSCRRSASAPTAPRSPASRRSATRCGSRRRASGSSVGVAYFSWIDTEMVRGADRTELGAAMRATLKGPLAKTYPVSAAAEAVVRGIERRSRIVACPRWLHRADGDPPAAPLARRSATMRRDIAEFDRVAEREAAAGGSDPVGAGGAAEMAGRRR